MSEIPASELLDDGVRFLVDGKPVSEEVALAANPLDEESQENWSKILKNTKDVENLEAKIASRIAWLSYVSLDR